MATTQSVTRYLSPSQVDLDKIASLCKRRGFIFQSSEIYGGLNSVWDYGPLGVELKNNVKRAWWRAMVQERDDVVGLDAAILMHPQVWHASGHVAGFADPLIDCKVCKQRFRADHLWAAFVNGVKDKDGAPVLVTGEGSTPEEAAAEMAPRAKKLLKASLTEIKPVLVKDLADRDRVPCPACGAVGSLTEPRMFNLMFKTFLGPVEDESAVIYMRPETAQGIFANFDNVLTSSRMRLPFGIAQTGKAFRNEITTGHLTFRSREFEQMELEYFVRPEEGERWLQYWLEQRRGWYLKLGLRPDSLRLRQHEKEELAHYAKDCYDVEFTFPWGWAELEGIANRGDFDLTQHARSSGKKLAYFDPSTGSGEKGEHIVPYVIEPSGGVDRATLAFLIDAYDEEPPPAGTEEARVVLRLHPALAPVKVAVLPLSRKEPLVNMARDIARELRAPSAGSGWAVAYDDAQSIGRRYRRQDEQGTPYCVTVDFQSLEDKAVTIRERDTMSQVRVPVAELAAALRERLGL
ncbi:MAG: glycine--tRNA ligase [Chloroflexi bacterium]|nr:glycine--tRNA ligase [Chloroflexota bacterium]